MWREKPGFYLPGKSNLQTIKAHFAQFLADRRSKSPFASKQIPVIGWGSSAPFEKVIISADQIKKNPMLHRNSLCIIEPWENVGQNPQGEDVRASINVAYIAQMVGDLDTFLLPVWQDAKFMDPDCLARFAAQSAAFVVEGGAPAVYDENTFTHPKCSREDLLELVEALLLTRMDGGAPGLFICLGHQLAAEAHVRLIKRAVKAICAGAPKGLCEAADQIAKVGDGLRWEEARFATTQNKEAELRGHALCAYQVPSPADMNVPEEVIETYELTAQARGLIDLMQQYAGDLKIDMFHRDIATQEAAIFCSWAYTKLYEACLYHRSELACSALNWLLCLPFSIKILASTRSNGEIVTANAATCIFYRDFDTGVMKRSFTTQFHPELTDDLQDFAHRSPPTYEELKTNAGNRMLVHLLQEGLHDA
ncbi:MAG: hypothetical protein H7A40_03680 [Chlamydiales bacterium]|nr:hypothetical protein [Chlamydiales bacterium]